MNNCTEKGFVCAHSNSQVVKNCDCDAMFASLAKLFSEDKHIRQDIWKIMRYSEFAEGVFECKVSSDT